jgi:sulfonate transport system ATP-binding protein
MLELAQVDKTFATRKGTAHAAVADIDLCVGAHEIVGLVGTSGCGKSTLLRIVSGLEAPSGGAVTIDGRRIAGPTPEIAMVFQEPRLMPWLSVTENVRLALLDLTRAEQQRRIEEALGLVGLAGFAEALPRQLSGGMAQRVAIARALARRPKILLLDEPFSALDSFTRMKLQDHLLALWEQANFTMVFVTHDLEEAVVLADRIVVLRGQPGRVREVFPVGLSRPRRRAAAEVQALKEEITLALDLS